MRYGFHRWQTGVCLPNNNKKNANYDDNYY